MSARPPYANQEDLFRRFSTYLPANFIFGLAFLGISWQLLEPVRYINPLATLLLLTGPTIAASKKFTDLCLYQVFRSAVTFTYACSIFSCVWSPPPPPPLGALLRRPYLLVWPSLFFSFALSGLAVFFVFLLLFPFLFRQRQRLFMLFGTDSVKSTRRVFPISSGGCSKHKKHWLVRPAPSSPRTRDAHPPSFAETLFLRFVPRAGQETLALSPVLFCFCSSVRVSGQRYRGVGAVPLLRGAKHGVFRQHAGGEGERVSD